MPDLPAASERPPEEVVLADDLDGVVTLNGKRYVVAGSLTCSALTAGLHWSDVPTEGALRRQSLLPVDALVARAREARR